MQNQKKGIAILGSTGSIGTQALEVIYSYPEYFDLQVLTAGNNVELLIEQSKLFKPNTVVIANEEKYDQLKDALEPFDIHVYAGQEALCQVVESQDVNIVLTALVGYAGLLPTIRAIEARKTIALANKETLVVAGELIQKLARKNQVDIYPVDSEHSAIFQCLMGEYKNPIEKIYLTASGGPFRGYTLDQLKTVTIKQALKHPNWSMGAKITIDSASMMNKGLEIIEAKWLFDLKPDQIDVIVHPQSIVHSIVQFEDGSMKAQMGLPDMKLPIQFALTYPHRMPTKFPRFNFLDYPQLNFEKPNTDVFKSILLAQRAMIEEGTAACTLNAANEVSVQAFLDEKITFLDILNINEKVLNDIDNKKSPLLQDYISADKEARLYASRLCGNK